MSELKPCPFCGGLAEILTTNGTEVGTCWYFAECMKCDTESGLHESEVDLEKAWNKRVSNEETNV